MAHVVVMGVMGCGKSTVGAMLGEALGIPFVDGDDFHSAENVRKMTAGTPLEDEDRWPWLADVAGWLGSREAGVVACSALKRSYRDAIRAVAPDAVFVHLFAPEKVVGPRVDHRRGKEGHFMGSAMLDSQFAILEPLEGDEKGVTVEVTDVPPALICAEVRAWLEMDNVG